MKTRKGLLLCLEKIQRIFTKFFILKVLLKYGKGIKISFKIAEISNLFLYG